VGKGLLARGVELKHFYVSAPGLGIGSIEGESPLPSVPIPMEEAQLNPASLKEHIREAVTAFAPDKVLITDSWNFKSHLLEALKDFPCYFRFHAAETLCPLNNIRYLPKEGQSPCCRFNFLATPEICVNCLQANRRNSGGLHNWERALSGVEKAGYYDFLRTQLGQAAGGLVNNALIGTMFSSYLRNTRVVTSGVNAKALFLRELADPPVKTLLMSGVVEEGMKGFPVLRKAGEILRQSRQDFRIVLTGRQAVQVDEYTWSVGWQSQEKLPELYAQADICIVPSICEEAFGIVAAEAMAAGRPVIASRVGGLQFSVVDGITGLLFEPGDAEGLAEKIALLLDNADLRQRMGAAGCQRAAQYDWQRIIEQDYLPILGL
jgi:glycosyltransferase involved in cell wall biosynthesis